MQLTKYIRYNVPCVSTNINVEHTITIYNKNNNYTHGTLKFLQFFLMQSVLSISDIIFDSDPKFNNSYSKHCCLFTLESNDGKK